MLAACGRDVPDGGAGSSDRTLFVEPATLDLYLDQTFTFDVVLTDDESPKSVLATEALTVEVGKAGVVEVNTEGTGTAKGAGQTSLIAAYLGLEAEAGVDVRAGRLTGIDIIPAMVRLAIAQTSQIRVTGTLDDGEQLDLTRAYQGTRYQSSDPDVATVASDGLVRGEHEGHATIAVTHGAFSGQVEVDVSKTAVELKQLLFDPAAVSLEFDGTVQLGVLGIDASGNRIDLIATFPTYPVTFSSSDTGIAEVSETAVVTALRRSGVTAIVAKLGDLTASAEVRVVPPESQLVGLSVRPEMTDVREGGTVQLRVTGRYADGSTADLTAASTGTKYVSTDPGAFSVSAGGLITGLTAGRSGLVIVDHGTFERLVNVNVVGDAELIGIEVRPTTVSLRVGASIQLQVRALFADSTFADVTPATSGVQYTPPPDGFATVTPDGLVRANFAGAGQLIVEYRGFRVFVPVTAVDEGQIVDIFISPPQISVPEGGRVQIQVFAQLSDGSVLDITFDPSLMIAIDRPRVAGYLGGGAVEGRNAGLTTLRATYLGFSAQADVIVGGMQTLIAIQLSIPPQIQVGQTATYAVLGIFSDGSIQDLTLDPQTQVTATDPSLLDVFFGLATGLQPGTTTVVADHLGFLDTAVVEVTLNVDPIVALNFQPSSLSLAVGAAAPAVLVAVHQSGLVNEVTLDPGVVYSSTGPISTVLGPTGLQVSGLGPGTGQVVATYQGLTARLDVTVGMTSTIVGIDIVSPSTIGVGAGDSFFVVVFFSDGTFSEITFEPDLMLSSSNPMILDVGVGSLTGISAGTANIVASYRGFTDVQSVAVGSDIVIALMFVPPALTMQVGVQATAQVIAVFASGRQVNVTFDPGLNINFNGPINIGPGAGGNIVIDAFGPGTASIMASYQGLAATLPITIQSTQVLVGITLRAPMQIDLGTTDTYRVIANFSDGSTQNVTLDPSVSISVADASVLSAMNGVLNGLSVGMTTVTANYQGFADSRVVAVIDSDPVVAIFWNPPQLNLQVGASANAQVFALSAGGNAVDVTSAPGIMLSATGPIITVAGPGGLQVTGNAQGNGQVTATYQGFVAGLPVTVGNAPMLVAIRIQPPSVQLAEGDTIQLTVIGVFSDGSESPISGATFVDFDPSVASISPTGLVTALSSGTGGALVTFGNFAEFVQIDVFTAMGPMITTISPAAVLVGSPATALTVNGSGFSMGDSIFVSGVTLTTTFVSGTRLTAQVPSFLLAFPASLDVQVRGANGRSNIVRLLVGQIPDVTSYSPDSVFVGSSVDVTAIGTGLVNLSFAATGGLTVTQLAVAPDGTWVRLRITAPATATAGMKTVTLSNPLGMDTIQIQVIATQGLMDLLVSSGQTVTLSGTNVYANVTVQTGGRILGGGLGTLAIIASNTITIRGTIDVSGDPGVQGFTNPAAGGDAGPGGGGGGGGGDGNAMNPAAGGAGSPAGGNAWPGFGAGTPGGDGGGEGGGGGGAFGCAHGGGGGALGGNGGSGGGDFGPGSGGFGGVAGGRGSTFGDGTGGGGGSTCGNASGGGGGGGGGGLILQVAPGGAVLVDGAIRANGGGGGDGFQNTGGGGGGSGGRVEVLAPSGTITVNDTISARGGAGGDTDFGDTGGGGGGGLIVIDATGGSANVGLGLLDVAGGFRRRLARQRLPGRDRDGRSEHDHALTSPQRTSSKRNPFAGSLTR